MNVLKTTKVVVIDDQPEEAIPVLKALGKIGVGAIYFSGDPDELPEAPLKGIRMLFLDLDLNGGGGEEEKIIGQTLSVLEKIIAKEPSPLAIIAWTKHTDYVEALKRKLQEEWNVLVPGFVTNLEKPSEFNEDAVAQITEKFDELVRNSFPLELLWSWEQIVHDAAVETTSLLAEVATTNTEGNGLESWNAAMNRILGKLGIAVAGQQLSEQENLLQDILAALNPVHMDHLERKSSELNLESERIRRLFETARKTKSDGTAESRLNTKFVIAGVAEGSSSISPGNIYEIGDKNDEKFPILKEGSLFGSLVYDVFDPRGDEEYRKLNEDYWRLKKEVETAEEANGTVPEQTRTELRGLKKRLDQKARELREGLKEGSVPVLLEITPSCDYAQRKNQMARFVGGMWVPQESIHLIKKHSVFLKVIGPLVLEATDDKPLFLVLNAHFLFGYAKSEWAGKARYRLRSQVLADVQAWFASHAARPGYTSVTP